MSLLGGTHWRVVFFMMENIENEVWKDVMGYDSLYQVSNFGRIKSLFKKWVRGYRKESFMSPRINKYGYSQVTLQHKKNKKTILVHRIEAFAFIPNIQNKPIINHINAIRTDNRIENLEWCTSSENIKHCFNMGNKDQCGSKNPYSKKVINIITQKEYESIREAQLDSGYSYNYFSRMLSGQNKNTTSFILK